MSTQVELAKPLRLRVPPAGPGPAEQPVTVVRPPRGWQLVNVRELWHFRELIYFLVWRDVKVRYKQTLLGAAWAVLQPAMMMVVFTIFFSRMGGASSGAVAYPLFVYAGLLPWTFFATAISQAGNSVVQSERLVSKIYFPRLAIPFAAVGASVVDFLIAFGLMLVLMVWYGVALTPQILLAPLVFAVVLLAAVGVGTLLGALNVAFRDFRYVIPFLVQMWMFATPTVYMVLPEDSGGFLHQLLALNPMTGLIAGFRATLLGGPLDWVQLGISSACAVVIFLVGCFYFRKVEQTFPDFL